MIFFSFQNTEKKDFFLFLFKSSLTCQCVLSFWIFFIAKHFFKEAFSWFDVFKINFFIFFSVFVCFSFFPFFVQNFFVFWKKLQKTKWIRLLYRLSANYPKSLVLVLVSLLFAYIRLESIQISTQVISLDFISVFLAFFRVMVISSLVFISFFESDLKVRSMILNNTIIQKRFFHGSAPKMSPMTPGSSAETAGKVAVGGLLALGTALLADTSARSVTVPQQAHDNAQKAVSTAREAGDLAKTKGDHLDKILNHEKTPILNESPVVKAAREERVLEILENKAQLEKLKNQATTLEDESNDLMSDLDGTPTLKKVLQSYFNSGDILKAQKQSTEASQLLTEVRKVPLPDNDMIPTILESSFFDFWIF